MEQFVLASCEAVGVSVDIVTFKMVLNNLGVETPADVNLLTESDLTSVLKTIHARKLLSYWKSSATAPVLPVPVMCHNSPGRVTLNTPDSTPFLSTPTSTLVIAQPQSTLISPSRRLQLPYCFPLHSIPDSLKLAIDSGERLTVGQQTQILHAIYQDVTKQTLYVCCFKHYLGFDRTALVFNCV